MTPKFASLVNPTIQRVLELLKRIQQGESVVLEHERALIRNSLESAEMESSRMQAEVKPDDFQLAKRCLIYWVDEVMTQATRDWKEISLEFEYFHERERAWRFYVAGENQARRSSPDVVELWYLAMALGFDGDIGEAFREHLSRPLPGGTNRSDQARQEWARELARQLSQRQFAEVAGNPLEGDLLPQTGAAMFRAALAFLAVAGAVFAVILTLWLRRPGA